MLIPAIAVPVADAPLLPLFAIPDGIDMTEPPDIVMPGFIVADAFLVVDVETASAAAGSLFHSMVIAGREGVAIGFMAGAEVTLDCWAKAIGAAATSANVANVEECI